MAKRDAGKPASSKREVSSPETGARGETPGISGGESEQRQQRGSQRRKRESGAPWSQRSDVIPASSRVADAANTLPRTASLAERQQRALALLCQGLRPPAIAAQLGTTPATARRWLRRGFAGIQREAREEYATALLRAVEAQREIAQAAWEAFHHEQAVEAAVLRGELDRVKRRAIRRTGSSRRGHGRERDLVADQPGDAAGNAACDGPNDELLIEEVERPKLPAQGARYLALAMGAQREMARLQGLYDELAEPTGQINITITRRPEGPENIPPEERAAPITSGQWGSAAAIGQGDETNGPATAATEDRDSTDGAGDESEGQP